MDSALNISRELPVLQGLHVPEFQMVCPFALLFPLARQVRFKLASQMVSRSVLILEAVLEGKFKPEFPMDFLFVQRHKLAPHPGIRLAIRITFPFVSIGMAVPPEHSIKELFQADGGQSVTRFLHPIILMITSYVLLVPLKRVSVARGGIRLQLRFALMDGWLPPAAIL